MTSLLRRRLVRQVRRSRKGIVKLEPLEGRWMPASLVIGDVSLVEGNAGTVNAVFQVTLLAGTKAVQVDYTTQGLTATSGVDFTAQSGKLSLSKGQPTATISIPVRADALDEPDETFVVRLSNPTNGATLNDAEGLGTILDDDPAPSVRLGTGAATLAEAGGTATVTATLSAPSAYAVTVGLTFAGTASPADYTASATTLTIPAGATSASMTLTAQNDAVQEPDETIVVALGALTNATAGSPASATLTILDDDAQPPTVSLGLSPSSVAEAGGVATVTASLSAPSGVAVTVGLTFAGTASAADYTASATTLTIPAGATSASMTLTAQNDAVQEPDETIVVALGALTNATAGTPASVTATILDDDASRLVQSVRTGLWSDPATWGGASIPGPQDDVRVATGHVVTVAGPAACRSFTVEAGATLVVASGGTLTFSADSTAESAADGATDRVRVEGGGVLECDPGGGTVSLVLGSPGWNLAAPLRLAGTAASRAVLRRKPEAPGEFRVTTASTSGGNAPRVSLLADFADLVGLAAVTATASRPGSQFLLRNCNVDVADFHVVATSSAAVRIEDNHFAGAAIGASARKFQVSAWSTDPLGLSSLLRNRFGRTNVWIDADWAAGANCNGMVGGDNVFEGTVTMWGGGSAPEWLRDSFLYQRETEGGAGAYTVRNRVENLYVFADQGTTGVTGNPHTFWTQENADFRQITWDYRGPLGQDIGDTVNFGGAPSTLSRVYNALVLPATRTDNLVGPLPAGTVWNLNVQGMGRLEVYNSTLFTAGEWSGIGLAHSPYSGPDRRIRVQDSLSWSSAPGKGSFVFTDVATSTDTLAPGEFVGNAGWNLGTYSNTVGGVRTPLMGFSNLDFSTAPTGLLNLDASGGPAFLDPGRNFIRWSREVRGHAGTDDQVIASGLADLNADPSLNRTSLIPWVRAGYAPQNPLMQGASAGGWIGAVPGVAPVLRTTAAAPSGTAGEAVTALPGVSGGTAEAPNAMDEVVVTVVGEAAGTRGRSRTTGFTAVDLLPPPPE
jgi:hypothetical protein